MRVGFMLLILCVCYSVQGQMTLRVVDPPEYFMPIRDSIYVAGDFNDWNPMDPAYLLEPVEEGWEVEISGVEGQSFSYKYTRGGWDKVESNDNGGFIPDRAALYSENGLQEDVIAGWEDFGFGTHTIEGNVEVLDSNFWLPNLEKPRRIWVRLPENYFLSIDDYPVLYLMDGQNVFDVATSFSGEWEVDEAMADMEENCPEAIVVAIDNGGADRIDEYGPWVNDQDGGGDGGAFAMDLVNEIKPFVDQHYRTLPDRQNTGIGGSSLGALISLYILLEYPDVFSKALLASPAFWFNPEIQELATSASAAQNTRFYFFAGESESPTMVSNMEQARDGLIQAGWNGEDVELITHSDGQHSEWYWAREYLAAYKFLYTDSSVAIAEANQGHERLWQSDQETLEYELEHLGFLEIYDTFGRMVDTHEINQTRGVLSIIDLSPGMYIAKFRTSQSNHVLSQKLIR